MLLRFFISTIIILLCGPTHGQIKPSSFYHELCPFEIGKTPTSIMTNIKFQIPCKWKNDTTALDRKLLSYFSYQFSKDSALGLAISVDSEPGAQNDKDIFVYSNQGMAAFGKTLGKKVITTRLTKIDGLFAGEIITESDGENVITKFFIKSLNYFIFYKDKILYFLYNVVSTDRKSCNQLFLDYVPLFKALTLDIVIIR